MAYNDEEINGIVYNPWTMDKSGKLVRCPNFGKPVINQTNCKLYPSIICKFCIHADDDKHTKWGMRLQLWKLGYGRNDSDKALSLSAIYKQEEINQLIANKEITYAEIGIAGPVEKEIGEIEQ